MGMGSGLCQGGRNALFRPAIAAIVTAQGRILAEIVQDVMPKTAGGEAIVLHPFQLVEFHLPPLGNGLGPALVAFGGVVDEELRGMHVPCPIEQQAFGLGAIPPRPACLLIVCLHILGHIIVDDIGNVLLVDAHAKGIGGHHDLHLIVEEGRLALPALFLLQARMVPGRGDAVVF